MTSRSDGTNTTTYAWDEDNRLTLVTLPSSATVAYTYDVLGRMLTRTDSSGTTYFTWDGADLLSELAPNGTQTRYYTAYGELLYFEIETNSDRGAIYGSSYYGQQYYGGLVYQIVLDALGSVRCIVDSYNNVVSTIDYDGYGNALPSTSDPLGFPYRFVGALGVRWDAGTGLYYMRQRWYDPTLQRFVSRDEINGINRYPYAVNNPLSFVDPTGLAPGDLTAINNNDVSGQVFSDALGLIGLVGGYSCDYGGTRTNGASDAKELQAMDNAGHINIQEGLSTTAGGGARGATTSNGRGLYTISIDNTLFAGPATAPYLRRNPNQRFWLALNLAETLAHELWHKHCRCYGSGGYKEPGAWNREMQFLTDLYQYYNSKGDTSKANTVYGLGNAREYQGMTSGYLASGPNGAHMIFPLPTDH